MIRRIIIILAVLNLAAGCNPVAKSTATTTTISGWQWNLPSYVPEPLVPADNPMSEEKFQLGRYLFYDTKLSGNGTYRCATCHQQNLAFTNGMALPVGVYGETIPRSAMSQVNSAFNATYTWCNPNLTTLERQAEVPLYAANPAELGIDDSNKATVLSRFESDSGYVQKFTDAFPGEVSPVNFANIIKAIASFERGLISYESKYDHYLQGTDTLNAQETSGMNLFMGEVAECYHCHGSFNFNSQVNYKGLSFVETPFFNNGDYNVGGNGNYPFPNYGLYTFTSNPADMGAFKAPTLRNVEVTGPYDMDGSAATLTDVLANYQRGGQLTLSGPNAGDGALNPFKSGLLGNMGGLTPQDQLDLIAFLKTLTDYDLLTNARYSDPFVP